uniref:Protein kinase family protein / ankyrin repeat family protein n=1 Tax=Musa balbisiana TaxID=52838 RepID=Q1EP25_MUSBA|nr:protein kinase family protein / ankyrin repeat family protein [Musa balbisiana]
MESKSTGRFTLGKQSSLAPDRGCSDDSSYGDGFRFPDDVDANIRLMYLTSEGDLEGIEEILASGVDVNFRDIDGRTALHVAACQGFADVVRLLLDRGAQPLADAIHYNNHEVIDLLEKHGAKLSIIPMHVKNAREVPEYEIDPSELDFTHSVNITKGTFRLATWRGIRVAVKKYGEDVLVDENKLWVGRAFRDELALLQQIRHPNVVQFLGAVTQSSPMMIVTEYLPKGDLRAYLKHKGALKPSSAVRFALDIARGMNYLHEHKPEAIIHRDLEPSNILRDDSGNLKVADFGVSKLLKVAKTVREERSLTHLGTACRYVAPEVFCNEEYDTKVDVFSFALILQEMIEGCPPFCYKQDNEVPKAFVSKQRPPFGAPPKLYVHGLKELIEECWSENPADRPTFKDIIDRLLNIQNYIDRKRHWRVSFLNFYLMMHFFSFWSSYYLAHKKQLLFSL